ncbi:MAG: hypothetical protein OXH81_01105 [Gemmatimonadetes bacterium]|nr:hypothetical protein [Gemmatimonadota bacterium]
MNAIRREGAILWGLALLWLLLFVASMLYHTGGRLALPLDDSFIYFQYARQAAQGHFLEYNTGAEPTAGATSLLYTLLLVPGFWLGLDGMGIALYALALGLVWLGLSARLLLLLGRRLSDPFSGWVAALMFLLCGPLLWGYYSGMAIGLFAWAILLNLYLYLTEDRRTPLAATLLVLARPEGIALVLLLIALVAYRRALNWRWVVPLGAYVFQALLLAWWTGESGASGVEAKWRFAEPHGSLPEQIRAVFFDFAEFVKGILAGSLGHQTSVNLYAYDGNYRRMVFAPFVALFVLAEISYRLWGELSERRLGVAALGGAWFVGGVLLTCTLVEYDAHFNRYQQPFLSLYILFAALGLGRLDAAGGEWGRKLARGLACFFGLWGLMSVGFFAVAYGENCSDIRNQQVEMARFIDAELPPDARIAVNDAGALRYFSGRQTIDLVGLTTAGNSAPWRHGSGSLFERLEAMPPEQRPQYFAIFPNWFNFPEGLFLQPLHRIRVFEPSIIDAEKMLYQAHWAADLSGEAIRNRTLLAEGWRVVDKVDVADLESERRHGYRSKVRVPGSGEANLLMALSATDDPQAVYIDGGRTVTGGERMEVALQAGRPATVIMRTVTGIAQHFAVFANGKKIANVELPGGRGRQWLELAVGQIAASDVSGRVEIETQPIHFGGDLRPIVSFHYWVLQP